MTDVIHYFFIASESGFYQVEVKGYNLAGDGDPTLEMIQTQEHKKGKKLPILPTIEDVSNPILSF